MTFNRLILLLLVCLSGFSIGLLVANYANWEKFITPVVTSISILLATSLAVRNLEQSRQHELTRRTLDYLSRVPKYSKEIVDTRVFINNLIVDYKAYEHPTDLVLIQRIMDRIPENHAELAIELLGYYEGLAKGRAQGIYDTTLIDGHVESTIIAIWREFWIFAKWNQLNFDSCCGEHDFKEKKPYSYIEDWAIEIFGSDSYQLLKPRGAYASLHSKSMTNT
ncbi:hypothetical protein ACMXYQ_16990 [Neptuniibacter sp. PT34_22]|uniref:DUF4760 domain-containing protein n=1 Tax=Neptuniibacter sp. PT34_22 TaxID=3398205 RepID=UPI0039F55300